MLSMLRNTWKSLEMKRFGPYMAQVTSVAAPFGSSVNSAVLCPSIGLRKSSLIVIFEGGLISMISIRPLPTLLLPSHSYTAPVPLAAPPKERFIPGSTFSQGDQSPQLWRSLMSGKIFSAETWMSVARCTRNVLGLVAANPSTPTIRTSTTAATIVNTDLSFLSYNAGRQPRDFLWPPQVLVPEPCRHPRASPRFRSLTPTRP